MNRTTTAMVTAMLAAIAISHAAHAQYLMVADWTGPRVMLIDAHDGHVVNADFIRPGAGNPGALSSPKEAIQVGNEIWVSNQVGDNIQRFSASLTPQFLGTISGFFDNVRGICLAGNHVYVTNDGGGGPATQDTIYKIDLAGNYVGEWFCTDPFDVVAYRGGLLAGSWAVHDLARYDLNGVQTGVFFNSPGTAGTLNNPQQLFVDSDDSVWVASSFSSPPMVLKIDADGSIAYTKILATGAAPRGIFKLGNGLIVFSQAPTGLGGIYTLDPADGAVVQIIGGSQNVQYFSPLILAPVTSACQPADIADDQGNPLPSPGVNSGVNEGDYNAFFGGFFTAEVYVDQWDDAGIALTNPNHGLNNGVNEGDYNGFFATFFDGCP